MNYPRRKSLRKRSKIVAGLAVTGEVLLTLGTLLGLFVVWYVVINDTLQGGQQTDSGVRLAQEWEEREPELSGDSEIGETPELVAATPSPDDPPVIEAGEPGEAYALLRVPRFGVDYVRRIGEGVDLATVLNDSSLGVGRYSSTNLLGEWGNVALAGHRTTFGASFSEIAELRIGDRLFVEVPEGWFSYQFRNHEYVWPDAIDVLNSFPRAEESQGEHRLLTLTSCHPRFSEAERIIAYAVFEGWFPRENGTPPGLPTTGES